MGLTYGNYTGDDINVIKQQLATGEVDIASVVERCAYGFPSIILLYPFSDQGNNESQDLNYRSISTLMWLTCPYLNEKIHALESDGYIDRIGQFIDRDKEYEFRMKDAHAHFYYLRKSVFRHYSDDDMKSIECNSIFNSGIGGSGLGGHLKCLHLHYAHYRLCKKNIAGDIVFKLLGERVFCDEGMCGFEKCSGKNN